MDFLKLFVVLVLTTILQLKGVLLDRSAFASFLHDKCRPRNAILQLEFRYLFCGFLNFEEITPSISTTTALPLTTTLLPVSTTTTRPSTYVCVPLASEFTCIDGEMCPREYDPLLGKDDDTMPKVKCQTNVIPNIICKTTLYKCIVNAQGEHYCPGVLVRQGTCKLLQFP